MRYADGLMLYAGRATDLARMVESLGEELADGPTTRPSSVRCATSRVLLEDSPVSVEFV